MGKSLVIKGANFSENGIATLITWVEEYSSLVGSTAISSDSIYLVAPTELTRMGMIGKTIKYVKFYAQTAGTIYIYSGDISGNPPYPANNDGQSFSVSPGVNIIELPNPITISNSVTIGVKGKNVLTYGLTGWLFMAAGSATTPSTYKIPIEFGYTT